MRIVVMSLVAMVLGTSAGLAMTWFEFRSEVEYFEPVSLTKQPVTSDPDLLAAGHRSGPKAVVVGGDKFDFGILNHDQTADQTFVIRNDGDKPLELSWSGESCGKCISNRKPFQPTTLQPGGSCEVVVTYATRKLESQFSEAAYIATNDPRQPSLQLQIVGFVTLALKLNPETLVVNSISTSEPTIVATRLFGFHSDELELVKYEYSNPELGKKMKLTTKPLDAEAVATEKHARTGLELQFEFLPGLPIGPLTQNVTLTAKGKDEHSIVLPITGSVIGDLSLYGRNYDATTGMLNIGIVNQEKGAKVDLFLLAKGPTRNDVRLSVGAVDPAEVLQVTIGEPTPLADGKAIKFPIELSVPPGAPVMNRLGTRQGKAATVMIETTHPNSKQVPITVRFAVE